MSKVIDLTGQKFGRLTVVERGENGKRGHARWWCQCDCGSKLKLIVGYSLINGCSKSCGCLDKELKSKRMKKYNEYDLSGEYGIGYTSKGEQFWFDLEDYDKIKDYCWCYRKDGYLEATQRQKNKSVLMHRIIMEAKQNERISHKIHPSKNKPNIDNRKSNLRIATISQSAMNQHLRSNNTSGITGVYWDVENNKWRAQIVKDGKHYILGRYIELNEAKKARKEAEKVLFGEWSFNNSQKPSNEEKGA